MKTTDDYRYLWDGAEPGWTLVRVNKQLVNLTLVFDMAGPKLKDAIGIRRAVPFLAELSASEFLAKIRGSSTVNIGDFELREARKIVEACRQNGQRVRELIIDQSGYLPFNENTKFVVVIEDDELASKVCEEAIRHGIQVKQVES